MHFEMMKILSEKLKFDFNDISIHFMMRSANVGPRSVL